MSVADEAGAVVSAVYWTNKAGVAVAKGTHRRAKVIGMHVQNWRHKGAGKGTTNTGNRSGAGYVPMTKDGVGPPPERKGSGKKNWTTDEERFTNTTTSHTTYTRKRTR